MNKKRLQAGKTELEIIGIDEFSVRKGHRYTIVVSDLIRKRPIWVGGENRKAESLDLFYQ